MKILPLKSITRNILFQSKWMLVIFYVGLVAAQAVYCVKFCQELFHLCTSFNTMSETDVMLLVLTLIDITMIGNLVKMIITGSYQTFIEKVADNSGVERVLSSGRLKIKMGGSLIGVSSIHLLQTFINTSAYTEKEIIVKCSIHIIFVVSTIGLAWIDYLHCKTEQIEESHGKAS